MFRGTANPLQRMVDSGSQFVDAAAANSDSTITLLETGQTVLQTQADHEQDIRSFARDLADLTGTLRTSDKDIRTILQGGPPAVREVNSLLKGLEPTLPVFLSNLVTVNQVLVDQPPRARADAGRLPARDRRRLHRDARRRLRPHQPAVQQQRAALHQGLQAAVHSGAPPPTPRDAPIYPAKCKSGPPLNMRGYNYAPNSGRPRLPASAYRVATYDARTGKVDTGNGEPMVVGHGARPRTVFGDDGWKWMLTGPVTADD